MEIELRADSGDICHTVVNKLEDGNVEIYVYNRFIPPNDQDNYPDGSEL